MAEHKSMVDTDMVDTEILRRAADYIDEHPSEYRYLEWDKCVAGVLAKLLNISPYGGGRHFSWEVANRVGLSNAEQGELFLGMSGVEDHTDARQVASFVRRFADQLDRDHS